MRAQLRGGENQHLRSGGHSSTSGSCDLPAARASLAEAREEMARLEVQLAAPATA